MKQNLVFRLFLFWTLTGASARADIVFLKDGSQITGTVTGFAAHLRVATVDGVRELSVDQVQSIRFLPSTEVRGGKHPTLFSAPESAAAPNQEAAPASPSAATPVFATTTLSTSGPGLPAARSYTLPMGTEIHVRSIDAIDSKTDDPDRVYAASLDEAIVVDGDTVVPAGADAVLRIPEVHKSGPFTGRTTVSVRLMSLTWNGERTDLVTEDSVTASSAKGKTTVRNGAIGAAGGCAIGAVWGPVGCGVGAAVGGGIGAGSAAIVKQVVKIPPETKLTFKLAQAVTISAR